MNKNIVVGLSGGVDSAVSAYLIKKESESNNVSAVFMHNWDDFIAENPSSKKKCTQTRDWEDSLEISSFLNIKLKKVNFVNEYWEKVFVNFLDKLKKGVTPNPDVLCNSLIKFECFANYARCELKADYIVTGHYARIIFDESKNSHYLAKCRDYNKDQTYFLCRIKKEIIPFLIFPLNNFEKHEVREIAKSIGLFNFQKKDSTGICFIGENNFNNFISNYLEKKEGDIVNVDSSKVIGKHRGAIFFTIGQKKGLNLGGNKISQYVIGKDVEKNLVYTSSDEKWLSSNESLVNEFNWLINDEDLEFFLNQKITVKFRHRQKEIEVKVEMIDINSIKIVSSSPVRAITPGQYAVLYSGEICLGGGVIISTNIVDNQSRPISFLNL